MKKLLPLFLFLFIFKLGNAQSVQSADTMHANVDYENIHVVKLESDSLASSFLIFIKKSVRKHKHEFHTEHVYVLEGEGEMILGDKNLSIKKGDLIFIPKNTAHSVTVTSKNPLKIISVQAPKFEGKDRVFVD